MPQEMYEERLRAAKPEKFAWERQVADGATLADLDEERIRGAVRLGVERGRMPATAGVDSLESILGKWNLMHEGKIMNGALALFGKSLGGYTQMGLRLARFRGTDKNEFVDSGKAEGNFFDLLDAGMAFLFKHLSLSGKIVGFQKKEQLEIPAEALREALTNALCHRQLEKYNLTPSIAVYDDRVEIENPGRLPFDLTPVTIKSSHASYPYNPLIAEVLYRSSFLESWGSGVSRMVDACKEQGVPEPEYEVNGGFVRIVFPRATGKVDEGINGPVNEKSKEKIKEKGKEKIKEKTLDKVYRLISENSKVTTAELAELCGVSENSIYKTVRKLRESGRIVRKGGDKGGEWVIT
jgi:ATP-dependent DNA helicase RecG